MIFIQRGCVMNKKFIFLTLITSLAIFACSKTELYDVEVKVVEPTCVSEGYTEHVRNDGYVYRDTFVPKTDHHYHDLSIGGDDGIVYHICDVCGYMQYDFVEQTFDTNVVIDENREKPVFTDHKVMPVSMIIENNPDDAIIKIRKSEAHGAKGIMIYITALNREYWTFETLQRIMYCTNLPILSIAYNGNFAGNSVNQSWEDFANLLKLSVQAGACAVDMPGYLFAPSYDNIPTENTSLKASYVAEGVDVSFVDAKAKEISLNKTTIQKQQQFIAEIHELGAEVLYSAHVNVEMSSEQIVAAAKFIQSVGVDVAKIVCSGSSKETVIQHLKACMVLENELDIKFSVHGQSTLSRLMCPMFGSYIAFCVDEYTSSETNIQIDLATMIAILESPELSGNN